MRSRPRSKFKLQTKTRRCGKCGGKINSQVTRCKRCSAAAVRPKK